MEARDISRYYNESPSTAQSIVYPTHKWELEKFKHKPTKLWVRNDTQRRLFLNFNNTETLDSTPKGFWKLGERQKSFFDWLYSRLGHSSMDDWYKLSQDDVYKNGGEGLISGYYNGSPSSALLSIYPQHNWEVERFTHKPHSYWSSTDNQKKFLEWLRPQLEYMQFTWNTDG